MKSANHRKNGAAADECRYIFDEFEIDPANRICLRNGEEIPLTGRVFDLLLVFAKNPGRLLEKDELIEKVWQAEFVEDGNLTRNVSTLRKALGGTGKESKYIATIQGHGYRFVAEVAEQKNGSHATPVPEIADAGKADGISGQSHQRRFSGKWLWAVPAAALLFSAAWVAKQRLFPAAGRITSLSVLPLRSLDPGENYLGVGIADAVIRRLSQSGKLTVRPTSAVIHYRNEDTDALTAAHQLGTEAVLEGTVQRAGERLRVSLNLLRTSDGVSLWTDSFDTNTPDIFMIQDTVARQVAVRLQLQLDPAEQEALSKAYTSSAAAYDFYVKGIYDLDQRGYGDEAKPQMEETVDNFRKAVQVDPNYALAHAQLAFAYAWAALFVEPENPKWAEAAREEITVSEKLDPQLAEPHLAKGMLLWSVYENYRNDEALRETILAKQLNPNATHGELAALYGHVGLDDLASAELRRELEIDPTSHSLQELTIILPYLRGTPDEWYSARKKLGAEETGLWYLMRKGQLDAAQTMMDSEIKESADDPRLLRQNALLLALKGNASAAEDLASSTISKLDPRDQNFHHGTYDIACVYALVGNDAEAVHWLRVTAGSGFPNYPLFERDPYLDRIRQTPGFVQFMSEQRTLWEGYRQEFGS